MTLRSPLYLWMVLCDRLNSCCAYSWSVTNTDDYLLWMVAVFTAVLAFCGWSLTTADDMLALCSLWIVLCGMDSLTLCSLRGWCLCLALVAASLAVDSSLWHGLAHSLLTTWMVSLSMALVAALLTRRAGIDSLVLCSLRGWCLCLWLSALPCLQEELLLSWTSHGIESYIFFFQSSWNYEDRPLLSLC